MSSAAAASSDFESADEQDAISRVKPSKMDVSSLYMVGQ